MIRPAALALALALPALAGAKDSARIVEAKAAVTALLKDPASAQFRHVFEGVAGFVCGEVNAKNAFGGYVGFRIFVVDDKNEAHILDPNAANEDNAAIMSVQLFCRRVT